MAIDYDTVKQAVTEYVRDVAEVMPVSKAVLFGSYAKGTATDQSDVDICFFLDSFNGQRSVDIVAKMLRLTHDFSTIYIEPHAFETSDIDNDNPFLKEVLSTGEEILI